VQQAEAPVLVSVALYPQSLLLDTLVTQHKWTAVNVVRFDRIFVPIAVSMNLNLAWLSCTAWRRPYCSWLAGRSPPPIAW